MAYQVVVPRRQTVKGENGVDPTKNVLDLVASAIARQDDLREANAKHIEAVMKLRAEYQKELRQAETARIDAIRAVDVGAVQQAAQVSATQATTLATQVATSAETLRGQVAAAAEATATRLAAALDPIQTDIADLRKAQYEAQGQKQTVVETRQASSNTGLWVGIILSALIGLLSVAAAITMIIIVVMKP